MIEGRVVRGDDRAVVAKRAWRTQSAWERMRGLLGRPALSPDEGLLIEPCSSVHTLGMGYPIDVVYLSREGRVVKIREGLAPLRLSQCLGAAMTLELAAGAAARHHIEPGQHLQWAGSSA